jgi:hypothetical protein
VDSKNQLKDKRLNTENSAQPSETSPENSIEQLLNLRDKAIKNGDLTSLLRINLQLCDSHPDIYQRLLGPTTDRYKENDTDCYCNNPKSLNEISKDMVYGIVPYCAIECDECWETDLQTTWLHYKKIIPSEYWQTLTQDRELQKLLFE